MLRCPLARLLPSQRPRSRSRPAPLRGGARCASSSLPGKDGATPTSAWVDEQLQRDLSAAASPPPPAAASAKRAPFGPEAPPPFLPPDEQRMTFDDEQMVFGYETEKGEGEAYGPACLLVAGLRPEEVVRVRELLDEMGGGSVKLLCADAAALSLPLLTALRRAEPDWGAPRPPDPPGGGVGSVRCLLFSGLDTGEKSAVVSALEARGLPRLAVTSLTRANRGAPLGEVLTSAVKADRAYVARLSALKEGRRVEPLPEEEEEEEAYDDSLSEDAEKALNAALAQDVGSSSYPTDANGEDPDRPDWVKDLMRLQEEVLARGEAGEDLSFLTDESVDTPDWMTQLLGSRSLEALAQRGILGEAEVEAARAAVGGSEEERALFDETIAAAEAERARLEKEGGGAGGAGREMEKKPVYPSPEGYGSLQELMEAVTGAEEPRVKRPFGPRPPTPPR